MRSTVSWGTVNRPTSDGRGSGRRQAIEAILAAGGVPVLAHFREAPGRTDIVRELIDAGLAGLEVYYRTFDAATVKAVGAVADSLGLLATGGTDYHGDLGTYAEAHADLWVPPEAGVTLLDRLQPERERESAELTGVRCRAL